MLTVDRVVAVPRRVGRRLPGVPADWNGFIPTDACGRVPERPDVYAAGDVTAFSIKQGGLATQQADVIAAVLAARAGADVPAAPSRQILRTELLGLDEPLVLTAELDGDGRPRRSTIVSVSDNDAPRGPAYKLFGRHLSPWMSAHANSGAPDHASLGLAADPSPGHAPSFGA